MRERLLMAEQKVRTAWPGMTTSILLLVALEKVSGSFQTLWNKGSV
jgi:hypothetical protein